MRISKNNEYIIRGYVGSMKNRAMVRTCDSGFESLTRMYLRLQKMAQCNLEYMSVYCCDDDTYDTYRVVGVHNHKFIKQ